MMLSFEAESITGSLDIRVHTDYTVHYLIRLHVMYIHTTTDLSLVMIDASKIKDKYDLAIGLHCHDMESKRKNGRKL